MPIFDFVKASPTIVYKKIIACFLLAVFTFIHAEKAFHTHQKQDDHTQQKDITVKLAGNSCVICDFQLAKDSELPTLACTDLPFTFLLKEYTTAFSCYHFLPATQISNRGPPAC